MTPRNHIILIGMPACGKSTVGVLLAKALGYRFVDADLVIQETDGRRLHEIIEAEGIDGFLSLEERVNLTLGRPDDPPTVIATGGSAVYSRAAMERYQTVGTVVYLRLSYETVARRLGDYSHRGVVMPDGYDLKMLYDQRCALCETYAQVTLDEIPGDRMGDMVAALCARFEPQCKGE